MKIGWIGTGIMGLRMAANLLTAGYDLSVYNRTQDRANTLLAQGATWAESPAVAAGGADCVITMLAHPQAVESAALAGTTGFLDAMRPDAIWIDSSTGNPSFARRMAAAAQARGVHFLDAPVSGSKDQAAQAHLIFFVGGDAADIDQCRVLFERMGSRIVHVGGHGMGTALKLVFNHLLGTSMVAFAEGLHLGVALGIPQTQLLELLIGTAVVPPYIAGKRGKLESGTYNTDFPLQWMQKDMHMVAEAAFASGVAMPLANLTKEIYRLAMQQGLSEADFSAIHRYLSPHQEMDS